MNTVEVLKAARAKIEQGWTQGVGACDAAGNGVDSRDPSAVSWCALGATCAADPEGYGGTADIFIKKAIRRQDIMRWNDAKKRTKAEVLAAFDRAIELAEKQ